MSDFQWRRHGDGFPISPVDRLPIFLDEAASAVALMDLIGGEEESANGSCGAVVAGFAHGSSGQFVRGVVCSKERTVATGGAAMSGFSESEGDNADAIDQANDQSTY